MQARKWIIGALAATFFTSSVLTPEQAVAGPADGLFGLAAGVIIGSALSQRQPVYRYRTVRPQRAYRAARVYRAPTGKAYAAKRSAPIRVSSDPFATQVNN